MKKIVGHLFQRIRSWAHFLFFVFGYEFILFLGTLGFVFGSEYLLNWKWPPAIAFYVLPMLFINSLLQKCKSIKDAVTKWSKHKLVERDRRELLRYNQGPQWQSRSGFLLTAQEHPKTQPTLFWTDLAVNDFLAGNSEIRGSEKAQEYELPKSLRGLVSVALLKTNVKTGRKKLPIRFNGRLVRLSTEPTVQNLKSAELEIQKVSYFDGECSNEILKMRDVKSSGTSPVESYAFDRESKFKALENSGAANIIGISIFAITADGYVVFVRQTEGNSVSPGSFASSGSGSLEYKDLKKYLDTYEVRPGDFDFRDLLKHGLLRELREESAVVQEDVDVSTYRLTSYFRWISRAAKPEFTAVVHLTCKFNDLKIRSTTSSEKAFSRNITSVPLKYLEKSAEIVQEARASGSDLDIAMAKAVNLAIDGLEDTHKNFKGKGSSARPSLSPSCEFAWFATAMYYNSDKQKA